MNEIQKPGVRQKIVWAFGPLLAIVLAVPTASAIQVTATFDDPLQQYVDYYDRLEASLAGAAHTWGTYLNTDPNAVIDVRFAFANIGTATGGWSGSRFVGSVGAVTVWEPEVAYELRTGIDVNPFAVDGIITIGINYLTNRFWYDPDPIGRTEPVPAGAVDATSTISHELGHIFGFGGWHSHTTGQVGINASPFDVLTSGPNEIGILYFQGEQSTATYGGPVPLTLNNSFHIGNSSGRPGDDLLNALMNGVRAPTGQRRWPTRIEYAMLADLGYDVALPTFLEGDFNADGIVNIVDYSVWRDTLGATGVHLAADANLDRVVDAADYALWRANFGRVFGVFNAAVAPAVPEPASQVLLVGLMVCTARAGLMVRRRKAQTQP